MDDDAATHSEPAAACDDDAAAPAIRYGLTPLGEALLARTRAGAGRRASRSGRRRAMRGRGAPRR